MPSSHHPHSAGSPLVAARVDAGFAHRTWSIGTSGGRGRFQVFFVTRGSAQLQTARDAARELTAPVVVWLPRASQGEFRLLAGGEGFTISVAEDFVWRAASDSPVALHLRPLFDRTVIACGERIAPQLPELRVSFQVMVRESREQEPGAVAICAAHLTLLLLNLWRATDHLASSTPLRGTASSTAQRFRQLVELHFRENVRINDYAQKLGVTRAHLHEACLRSLGRTPLAVVHDRLIEEAQARLEHTELPVEQVGYSLGFRDPAYFNRFFKKQTGRTPAAFRMACVTPLHKAAAASFAAWP